MRSYKPLFKRCFRSWYRSCLFGCISSLCFLVPALAGGEEVDYDEVLILLHVDRLGSVEMPVLIRGEEVYLPILEVFQFLKIKANPPDEQGIISGFSGHPGNSYLIDPPGNRIHYQGKIFPLEPAGLIREGATLYLKSNYYGEVFGLECTFNFRNLSVLLRSRTELPAVRDMRLAEMRQNVRHLKKEFIADTTIGRYNPLFHFGVLDWAVNSMQQEGGMHNTRINLGLGASLAGGELKGQVNYNDKLLFLERNQYYLWRYVDNDSRFLKQVSAGKIATQPISSVFRPVLGVQLTNAPTYRRSSFGTYTYSNQTHPGWMVELYMNNTLVDYTQADASGFFTFDIPLIYGNTEATLRYHGPWGEEETSMINFNIPFNFLPPGEMEYTLSSGIVQDGDTSRFSQARLNFGLSRNLTVGGGLEYLSSVRGGQPMPFVTTSARMKSNVLFSGEYTYGVRSKGSLSYFSPSRLQLEFHYTRYEKAQEAVKFNYQSEAVANASMPFRLFNTTFLSRLSLGQNYQGTTRFYNGRLMLSGSVRGVSLNLSSFAIARENSAPYVFSNLSTSFLLPAKIIFSSQLRYVYNENMVSYFQVGLKRKVLRHGNLQTSYERDLNTHLNYFRLGFLYDFSFARMALSSNFDKNQTVHFQSAGGSFTHDPKANYVNFSRNSNAGRGGIALLPFLDLNHNGKKDWNEPKVNGLNVKGKGGHIEKNRKDSLIVISGLEPYTDYFLEIDGKGFDNIAWQLRHSSFSIAIEPNQLKLVEVPVEVVGEAAGMVYLQEDQGLKGQGRISVHFYDGRENIVASVLSEPDGYFSHFGLPPGAYKARIDETQLEILQMSASPGEETFLIHVMEEGDYVDHLKFVLKKEASKELLAGRKNSLLLQTDTAGFGLPTLEPETKSFGVLLMATSQQIALDHPAFKGLEDVQVHYEGGLYKYTMGAFPSIEEAFELEYKLKDRGFANASVEPLAESPLPEHAAAKTSPSASDGVVYKVQVLASRRMLSAGHRSLRGLEDVQMYFHQGMYKYTWGEFTSTEPARILENELKDRGLRDAFVVKFNHNKRVVYEDEGFGLTKRAAQAKTKDLVFRVQIAASRQKAPADHVLFKNLDGVHMYYHEGMYKYTWGAAETIDGARELKSEMRQKGFAEAFIVPFYKNERLHVEIEATGGRRQKTKNSGLVFRAQLLTSRRELPVNHDVFRGLNGVRMYHQNGLYKYAWGEAHNSREAGRLKKQLHRLGFTDAFIVPFYKR